MIDAARARRRRQRPAAVLGAVTMSAALLVGLACVGADSPRWRWDRDAEVLPLKQVAPVSEEPRLRSVVVLLPDADGTVGVVEVSNPSGAATLRRAGEAVAFEDLSSTFMATDEQAREADRPTLDAEPEPPRGFTVYFRTGGARLEADSETGWQAIVDALRARNVPEVTIAAHTDRAGSERFNLELSRRRAEAIREALVQAGLDGDLIEIAWHGEGRPVVPTEDGVAEPRNRRADIRVR